ncbi:MAG TPA: hypothetical protein VJ831_11255 [Jatrophihabitantaceae bacterium]|nr:hypothetical protein [Jatrophihabitantaceae bacterium]
MSPSEESLRRALHDGEGDDLDPAFVVMRAESYRRARRGRISGIVAAATVVAGIGIGTGVVVTNGNGTSHKTGNASAGGAAQSEKDASTQFGVQGGSTEYGSVQSPPNGVRAPALSSSVCADTIPLAGEPPRAKVAQHFFAAQVTSAVVCAYKTPDGGYTRSLAVSGENAQTLARSLDLAPTTALPCPMIASKETATVNLVIWARYASGAAPAPVVVSTQTTCRTQLTNGVAVRYSWNPPQPVAVFIAEVRAANANPTLPTPTK